MTKQTEQTLNRSHRDEQEIDLLALVGTLLDRKWFIIGTVLVFTLFGALYAILSTPIYKATAMIIVEEATPSLPGLDDMTSMFESSSEAVTEIELLKSRSVIGSAVDNLQLTIESYPNTFPIVGNKIYRDYRKLHESDFNPSTLGFDNFAWGGEDLDVHSFEVPQYLLGEAFTLTKLNKEEWELRSSEEDVILTGLIGQTSSTDDFSLTIKSFNARPGTDFSLIKHDRFTTIKKLQQELMASEKGKDSGIINVSFEHFSPKLATEIVDEITSIYVRQNVEKNSAEAAKSLEFLKNQLPQVKQQLERAEAEYNSYQQTQNSVNISLETQAVLEQIVEIDTLLQQIELRRVELSRKFTTEHPSYQAVEKQYKSLQADKEKLLESVNQLPETQQALLRLLRDVEVNNEIYTLLLSKAQELDIIRAGTLGNVRIVDTAAVDITEPVKPKKILIVVISTLLGGFISVAIVLIQKAIHKGVEDAVEIEQLGLSVYATIPHSSVQEKFSDKFKTNKKRKSHFQDLLSIREPADQAVESLRSLRTSLHFVMLQSNNNVIAISGPSPGVGKSFISSNLAAVLAASEKRILLIDGDMRKGYLHKAFALNPENGLSDILSGTRNYYDVIKKSSLDKLDIITRGSVPPNPSELLMHGLFEQLIENVKADYDIVLIDTPPILAVTDPSIIAKHAGSTILVTRYAQNPVREIELACKRFENAGITIHGAILNDIKRSAANRYGYYGYYGYYNYEYNSDKN